MEQKDFDIYEILKGVPAGTELYTPMCGKVKFTYLATNKEAGEAIFTEDRNGEYSFNKNGRWMEGGEVMLFPSNEMRDWSKFFKKGDVLVTEDGAAHIIFEKFTDDTYTILLVSIIIAKMARKDILTPENAIMPLLNVSLPKPRMQPRPTSASSRNVWVEN